MYFGKIMSLNFVMKGINLICAHLFLPNPIFNFQYNFSWTVSWTFLRNSQFLQTATLRQEHPAPSFPLCRWDTLACPREATGWRRTHKIATGISFCTLWALLKGPLSFLLPFRLPHWHGPSQRSLLSTLCLALFKSCRVSSIAQESQPECCRCFPHGSGRQH